MKTRFKKHGLTSVILLAGAITANAQMNFNAQYMARGEYRHGYNLLADTLQDPAYFVSQRARLSANYKSEKFSTGFTAQDIRTWGSTANMPIDNAGLLSIQEAWAELNLTKKLSVRTGRQQLSYDDDRILGSLDWAMQARRHDAAVFKFQDDSLKLNIHAGFAFNQDKELSKTTVYTVAGNYKTMQYLWMNKAFGKKISGSLLFLNNGMQFSSTASNGVVTYSTKFSQTMGTRWVYKSDKIGANFAGYYQMGDDVNTYLPTGATSPSNKKISAYDAAAEVSYKIVKPFAVIIGGELLSGTSQMNKADYGYNNSFAPLYGTNHRFNGYMDYFYVGNHGNSVGLQDLYLKLFFEKGKMFASLNTHMFSAVADIKDKKNSTAAAPVTMSKNLGQEVDFTTGYNFADGVAIQAGYSQFFATKSMEMLKNGSIGKADKTQNWAYLMLIVRPGAVKWPKVGLKML